MKTQNFINLIQAITKRDFNIKSKDLEFLPEKEYFIFRVLPASKREVGFNFKTPKNEENLVRSFINQFCKKYREPNPANYDGIIMVLHLGQI